MSSQNYFDLLDDDENEEPTAVITRATLPLSLEPDPRKKSAAAAVPGRVPSKQQSEAARELKATEGGRGGRGMLRGGRAGRGGHRDRDKESGFHRENRDGFSRERGGYNDRTLSLNRENNGDGSVANRGGVLGGGFDGTIATGAILYGSGFGADRASRGNAESWSSEGVRGRGVRGSSRGRDRAVGDGEERSRRREFDRRSGSGFGNEIKRDGSGRGNWGAEGDQGSQQEVVDAAVDVVDKIMLQGRKSGEVEAVEGGVFAEEGVEKKEEEDNELTLDEYEKILDVKRKALLASKAEERKVQADKAFASMLLVDKKSEDVFIKLGSEKEKKKKEKEALEKEEKARKTQSINEFLKPADGETYYGSARGRGRGRGARNGDGDRIFGFGSKGHLSGGFSQTRRVSAPRIEDPGQFPTLGAK